MANLGSVVIQFLAENKMGQTLGNIKRGLDDVDESSGKSNSKISTLFNTMAGAIPIAGAVVAGVVGVGVALVDMSKDAMADKESMDKLAGVLGKIPGISEEAIAANEQWITSMQIATHVSDTDLRVAVQKLALATGDLGDAQKLTALAVDTASASGKNLSSVTDAMARAADGNTASLKRMFPWLDSNKDGTLTYAEAVDGLTDKFKGAAGEAAKTKPWETIGIIWDELKESIGNALLPVLQKLGDWFAKPDVQADISALLKQVESLATQFGEDLLEALEKFMWWLKKPENRQKITDWIDKISDLASAVGRVIGGIQTLIHWMGKIPSPKDLIGWIQAPLPGGNAAATSAGAATASTRAAAAPPPAPVVMVTEEQIARAIQRVLMRSDGRNGRITRIA